MGNASALCVTLMVLVAFGCGPSVCLGDNFTDSLRTTARANAYQTRKHRLLSFNTDPKDNIEIELDFTVPFISIPVKADLGTGSMANLNIGAVALAGMMAFGAAFVIPATYHLFSAKNVFGQKGNEHHQDGSRHRSDDNFPTTAIWSLLTSIDKSLTDHNIDSTSCMQRAICWMVKDSSKRMSVGKASSTDKIVDGLATNPWLSSLVDGSVFQAAIDSGLQGQNCSEVYKQCSIDQDTIRRFSKQLMSAVYNRK